MDLKTNGYFMDVPSSRYECALPLGNGRLGAMVGGQISQRTIWINEETVWYGGPRDRNNPDAINYIDNIKKLVSEGEVKKAEQLAILSLTGIPETQRHYSTLGMITFNFTAHNKTVTNYCSSLDFSTATTTTSYEMDGVSYEMKIFVNQSLNTIVIKLTASEPVLDFYVGIERGERVSQFSYATHQDEVIRDSRNGIIISGNCGGKNALDFTASMFGESDGQTTIIGEKIVIKKAKEAVLYISGGTNYKDTLENIVEYPVKARDLGYDECYKNHLEEWMPLYSNVTLKVKSIEQFSAPAMDKLFDAFENDDVSKLECMKYGKKALDDYLMVLYFNFGRYILLSTSRKCEIPATLQGIWCRDLLPVWDGKYTANINLQMNYWAADSANMSGCFESYIKLAERIRVNGSITAKKMYGCRGFVLHNNTDIWADCAVQDSGEHCSYWFVGGVWIAIDMFEHYRYTNDKLILKRIWPIMRDAALFVIDFMQAKNGKLVMGVTTSPENFYISESEGACCFCEMCAMDAELIELLFDQCIEANNILGNFEEIGFINEVEKAKAKIEKPKIAIDGPILEWGFEVSEHEPKHRHLSHLIGAYPYNNITEKNKELLVAVDKSLAKRIKNGGCNTGWSRAWGAGLKARLKKGDEALELINTMVRYSSQPNLMSVCNIGSIPKLLDNNKPMQIDGTIGTVQAVIEMLIQSYNDELILLPALPSSLETGSVTGLVSRGNIVVDVKWKDNMLEYAVLKPRNDIVYRIVYKNEFKVEAQDEILYSRNYQLEISLKARCEYLLTVQ